MKRSLLSIFAGVLLAPWALASTDYYINNGVINVTGPAVAAPQIDAVNFVNNGLFIITNQAQSSLVSPALPFQTWDTLNWTNRNLIGGDPGFRFDFFDSASSLDRMSANFVNANSINESNALVFGNSYVEIFASNVINRGTLGISGAGLLRVDGDNVDLKRSQLAGFGNQANENGLFSINNNFFFFFFFGSSAFLDRGFQDRYWGVNFDFFRWQDNFQPSNFHTPPTGFFAGAFGFGLDTTISNLAYVPYTQELFLTNGFTYYMQTAPDPFDPFLGRVDLLFLAQADTNITTEVRFFTDTDQQDFFFGTVTNKVVLFQSLVTNRLSGVVTTNQLYLSDTGSGGFTFLTPTLRFIPPLYYFLFAEQTFHPLNYTITHTFPTWADGTTMTPVTYNPAIFGPPNSGVPYTFSSYGLTLTPEFFSVEPSISGSTFTNVPGRIEIRANNVLDLSRTRMDGESYLLLRATNHFVGSTNAQIISPFSDIYLASTNGSLKISELVEPTVPRICGPLDIWTGNWTDFGVINSNTYNVTVIDSHLVPEVAAMIQNLTLRSSQSVFISDIMNVFNNLLVDTEQLTITSNAPGAPSLTGELNLTSIDTLWASSLPRLQYLTNFGKITAVNDVFFGGARQPPFFTSAFTEPYQSFVNHGLVATEGNSTWAVYYENTGTNATNFAGNGPISLQADTAFLIDGAFIATNADISITSGSLIISNHTVLAGRSFTLLVTNVLDDGSLATASADFITNKNIWTVGDGINHLGPPGNSSLLGTTVTNTAAMYVNVLNRWSGQDEGCSPEGFNHNAALGRLILDGGFDSVFEFQAANSINALYVDYLEFRDYTTNTDASGNWVGVQIDPNMKVYYGQAVSGGLDVSEKLNGKNDGRFCWVSDYNCGFFSSTNMIYPDGSTNRVNTALAQSCDIDSNTNGIPNCSDPAPISNPAACPPPQAAATSTNNTPPPDSGGSTNTPGAAAVPTLEVPAPASSSGVLPNGFALAKGAYNGLFAHTNGVAAASSGYFTATTTERRTFTAKVTLGGRALSISGFFNSQGSVTRTIVAKGKNPLTVQLQLDLSGGNQISGHITDGVWSADLLAYRKSANSSSLAGNYTMQFPADALSSNGPGGIGYGTAKVDARGSVQWSGVLADGTKVSQKTGVSSQGTWPLYASLYSGNGSILSWMQFADKPDSDFSGQLLWLKTAAAGGKSYARGFTNEVESATASRYLRAAAGPRLLDAVFSGGGLHDPFTNSISLGLNNKIAAPNPGKLTLSIAPASGLFKGTALNPLTGKAFPFQGVLLEKPNIGAGFFLNADQSGQIFLSPAP
ncbi:MAG: hypothetical protein QOJ40_216 [Verrucomicrobiota bacterium]